MMSSVVTTAKLAATWFTTSRSSTVKTTGRWAWVSETLKTRHHRWLMVTGVKARPIGYGYDVFGRTFFLNASYNFDLSQSQHNYPQAPSVRFFFAKSASIYSVKQRR